MTHDTITVILNLTRDAAVSLMRSELYKRAGFDPGAGLTLLPILSSFIVLFLIAERSTY